MKLLNNLLLFIALNLVHIGVTSAQSNFYLDDVKLNELAKIVYVEMLKANYVASDDFINSSRSVTINLNDRTDKQVLQLTKQIIESSGFDVVLANGVYQISKHVVADSPDLEPFYYTAKYRDVQYLTDMVSSIFKVGKFTFNRALPNPQSSSDRTKPEQMSKPVQDTGNSAYSQISKPFDAFIFNGTKQEIELLKKLLVQLDTPENQVQITAYLYEVSNTDSNSSSFTLAANVLGGIFKLNLAGQVISNSLSFTSDNFQAGISALAADTRFNVISSPQILVKNRQKGSFSVGADVPILGQVSYQNNGQPVQAVEYKPSGVILDLTPTFHDENIELTIHHQISNFVQTTTGVNASPTLIKRELNTVVNSRFEDIILLGGLSETKDTKSKSGLPFLPDFLKSNASDKSKSDILLLLHVKKI